MKPELRVSVISDYICPFCYIGHKRLEKLRDDYELKIQWCFVEIHPETPQQGQPVEHLGYSATHWQTLMQNLQKLAAEDGITFAEHRFTCNSRKALLLAEASKTLGSDIFYALHNAIFDAFFIHSQNIGDEQILRQLAKQHGIPDALINQAWDTEYANGPADHTPRALLPYLQYAGSINASSVPTFAMGTHLLTGAVATSTLRDTAKKMLAG
jgi:predicted DsbA family dithiol-disulfide isomerase